MATYSLPLTTCTGAPLHPKASIISARSLGERTGPLFLSVGKASWTPSDDRSGGGTSQDGGQGGGRSGRPVGQTGETGHHMSRPGDFWAGKPRSMMGGDAGSKGRMQASPLHEKCEEGEPLPRRPGKDRPIRWQASSVRPASCPPPLQHAATPGITGGHGERQPLEMPG